jgi:adhesin transport system outer membrane protein
VRAQEAVGPDFLEEFVADTVEGHDRVLAARADVEAARQRSLEALGAWYPELEVTANVERYHLQRSEQNTVIAPAQELTGTITQLLWDFGATNAALESARLSHVQSEISLVQIRQDLTAEALAAYINLLRSAEVVLFARRSEENIRRQTGLEEARIQAGSGLSTDLLQAKTQLAGAQARRVDAEGAYELALNRYRAVFGDVPGDLTAMPGIDIDRAALPGTLTDALDVAFKGNPQLRLTSIDISIAQQERRATQSSAFAPTFEVIGERSMTKNDGGTIGRRIESSIKLELSFPFNLGFTAVNTLRAAQSDVVSATRTMGDLERQVEERVRNAWKQLGTAQERAGYLFDQAGIARAFLEVAIQERQLGQRSLIDVLSGETALINAQSDAVAAEADVLLAIVELLAASGALDYSVIRTVPRTDRSEMLEPIAGLSGAGPDPSMELLDPEGSLGDELDPSGLLEGDSVFTPPADDGLTEPMPEPAPEEPPAAALDPAAPDPAASDPVIPEPPATGLDQQLDAAPSFDAVPRPQPPPEPPPRTQAPEQPPLPELPPAQQPAPAAPPESGLESGLESGPEPPAQADPDTLSEPAVPEGDLDNPLFDWAQ